MNKEIFILNNSNEMFAKENINNLITEINTIKINKTMKKFLLVASLNLISRVKTAKALQYQLQTFRNQGKIIPEKTKSKYINALIAELNEMSPSDFTTTINNLINYIISNNINIKI